MTRRCPAIRRMLKIFGLVAAALTLLVVAARWVGADRWTARTRGLRSALDAARMPVRPLVVDVAELDGLPAPVQRFFRAVLTEGQPLVAGVRLQHTGTFDMGETTDQWKTFRSDQQVITQRPGFRDVDRVYLDYRSVHPVGIDEIAAPSHDRRGAL